MSYPCIGGCGRSVSGLRCQECKAKFERVLAAVAYAEADALLLREFESKSKADIARERRVSRPAIGQRIAKAQMRQQMLREFQEIAG